MVKLRFARHGSKKRPFYRIVAADSRSPRDGRYIESLGFYNPCAHGAEAPIILDQERVSYWLGEGAQPSERVKKIIKLSQSTTAPLEARPSRKEMKKNQAEAMHAELQKAKKAEAQAAATEAKKADASDDAEKTDS